jgi:hypothetical protein
MESEGLLQHYVKTELFTVYVSNNSSSAIGYFMVELLFHKMQPQTFYSARKIHSAP